MDAPLKILLLDDDADWLEMCRDIFSQLSTKPEIRTVTQGSRALGMLDSEPFRLLVCDLKMPRMDGLQVLSVVRRRFPGLRTVVLSGLQDEEFRSRAYALGVDLFWQKSDLQADPKMFLDCVESLLGQGVYAGFRGVQNKGLMDIIQMEYLSRSSTVLRITHGPLVAKLWFQDGDLLDAEVEGVRGEAAFGKILAWKTGTFENLPAEPNRERTVTRPINALLLEFAQALDESTTPSSDTQFLAASHRKSTWRLSLLMREGAEFVITAQPEGQGETEAFGTQAGEPVAAWTRHALQIARQIGEKVEPGPLSYIGAVGLENQYTLMSQGKKSMLLGWRLDTATDQLHERSKKIVASWDS